MKDIHLLESIKRIENSITESNPKYSCHDYMIASMVMKGFRITDAGTIKYKQILMCDVHDMNLCIALKNNLHLYDIENFNDNDNLAYVMKTLEMDEPLSILNNEVREVLDVSKVIVEEITKKIDECPEELTESADYPIDFLFSDEVRNNVKDILENSFEIFRFFFSVDLLFTRKDGSQFIKNSELAGSVKEIETGFARRPVMPDDAAMWYEFDDELCLGFVTKDVCRKLSVAYVRADGTITEIIEREADDCEVYYNEVPAKYIMEVPSGWFLKNGIEAGDKVRMKTIIAP